MANHSAIKLHKSITTEKLLAAATRRDLTLDNPGICIECGHEQDGCEPDARELECEVCREKTVYSPEEIILEIV